MSDNPFKKKAKAKRRGRTPGGSQDAAPLEQGGAAEGGPGQPTPGQPGKEDAPNVESKNEGPWPFALGPMSDDTLPDDAVTGDPAGDHTVDLPADTPIGNISAQQPLAEGESAPSLNPEVRKQLVLVKHGHRYVFRYERGEETKVLSGLVDLARDPHSELDWFDAAVLSHQLGERMSEQLERLRRA